MKNISKECLPARKHINALVKLAKLLNKHNFEWSLGASLMLKLRGFDVFVDDIDVIVKTEEITRFEEVLKIYNFKKGNSSTKYPTNHFYELSIDGVDVDIMIGFKIYTDEGIYNFDDTTKVEEIKINGTLVYLSSLEEWLNAYNAMNRKDKISIIQECLKHK